MKSFCHLTSAFLVGVRSQRLLLEAGLWLVWLTVKLGWVCEIWEFGGKHSQLAGAIRLIKIASEEEEKSNRCFEWPFVCLSCVGSVENKKVVSTSDATSNSAHRLLSVIPLHFCPCHLSLVTLTNTSELLKSAANATYSTYSKMHSLRLTSINCQFCRNLHSLAFVRLTTNNKFTSI